MSGPRRGVIESEAGPRRAPSVETRGQAADHRIRWDRGPARKGRVELPDYLPARMLNEFVYCPRLFFYEWVEGVFRASADTEEGKLRHEKLETRTDPLPPAANAEGRIHSRSVTLSSDAHHLITRIDLIEGEGRRVIPVEYKRGSPRDGVAGPEPWPADAAQVSAQALVLRDNGYECDEGVIYYNQTKQRVSVPIGEALVDSTSRAIEEARALAGAGVIPPPLVDSPKCPRCSLVTICLPDETAAITAEAEPRGQLDLFGGASPPIDGAPEAEPAGAGPGEEEPGVLRRLVPARDDLKPLYVIGHGLLIGKSGETLEVRERGQKIQQVRLIDVSQVNVFGNVQLTAGAIQALCWAEKPVAYFSYGGWFYGMTQGLALRNVFLRREQFRASEDPAISLVVARTLTISKIRNQRTILRRNHPDPGDANLNSLRNLAEQVSRASGLPELLGIEGNAARVYFGAFGGMLKATNGDDLPAFEFTGRNRRPPRDPVNALLSLGYSLLAKDLTIVCHSIGFDPFVGFYHQPRFGRPALALDLMEMFRPLIVDSVVLSVLNGRIVGPRDFIRAGHAVALTPSGRKAFLVAYEQRMDALVTHPLFGYRVSYRRVLEIHARLLARFLTGEIPELPRFETR